MAHLEQSLNEQYMITQSLSAKEQEMEDVKTEFESTKLSLKNCQLELKTLRKENDDIKKENEQYQTIMDKLREQEIKLKKQLNDQQLEIQSLSSKYNEINNKLQLETVETRQQLQVARHIANNLSDQLEEIQNFQASGELEGDDTHDNDKEEVSMKVGHTKSLTPFGRPLFEKRKTLKIINVDNGKTLKLPNMSELMGVDENFAQSDEEYVDFIINTKPGQHVQPPALKIVGRRSSLPPVSEFQDDDADHTDLDFDEKVCISLL